MIATELHEEIEQTLQREPAKVSVVVPSYNHARFIKATLRSIMKQTLPPAELIVIDDGSSDESPRVIESVLQNCPFACELIARNNRGLCATLNEGFERTRGDYFAYLGSDDLWLPDFLQARVQLLKSRARAVLAYGHAYFIDEENRIIDSTADWASYADGNAQEMLLQTTAPMSPTVLYRRAALEQQRWNEAAKLEDYDLYLRLSAEGEFAFDPRILSAWRRHSSNVSWDQTLMLEEQLQAQRDAALRFGFSAAQIARLQTATRFSRAEDFMRVGQKSQALGLMVRNPKGVRSPGAAAKMLLRLLIPNSFMRGRARVRQRRAHERYGSIDV
ncbi:MAG TPA: glycosyltransferase family A protein [Pyrinomonadaceae bacterium]|jgi:alpha-1,3-rhamnosyltransferase|nr:glycosyltransferase family A protein [Pyrinomonadaceae bacterium]